MNAGPQRACAAARKVRAGGAAVRHEDRIVDERGVADEIGDRSQRVARSQQDVDVQVADPEAFAVGEELVPLRTVGRERGVVIVDAFPQLLHVDDLFADRGRHAGFRIEIAGRREVVGVGMRVQNPDQLVAFTFDVGEQGVGRSRRRGRRIRVEIEDRVDDGAGFRFGIGDDVLNALRALLEEAGHDGSTVPAGGFLVRHFISPLMPRRVDAKSPSPRRRLQPG